MPEWVDCVLREARQVGPSFGLFDSLYIGGGTPSLLSEELLARLIDGLHRELSFGIDTEVSIEVNPGDVDLDGGKFYRSIGVSRVSVGVQSFDDGVLRFLGRRHDRDCAVRVLDDLRAAGFWNLGIDLIWGIPGQSRATLESTMRQGLAFAPEHISCYSLTSEDGTPLHSDMLAGLVAGVDDEDLADEASVVWSWLRDSGYEHYEVSSFARTREFRSRHNAKYWGHVPYLGLGPAAHSFDGLRRWSNVHSVREYVEAVVGWQRPVVFEEELTDDQMLMERVMLGLRTSDGVDRSLVLHSRVEDMVNEGLLCVCGDRIVPTERGMLVSDAIAGVLCQIPGREL